MRPGRSSAGGGIDEFPLFRETSRSSRSILAARSATCPASLVFSAAGASITRACITITASRAASSGIDGTGHHDRDNPVVIKPARWDGNDEIAKSACQQDPVRSLGSRPGSWQFSWADDWMGYRWPLAG
jgi:hypothetical protein